MLDFFWTRKASWLASVVYILLGLVLIIFPDMSGTVFCWGLAAVTILYGLVHFVRYFRSRKEPKPRRFSVVLGVVMLAAGVFCAVAPKTVLSILPWALGALLLLDGVGKIPVFLTALKAKMPGAGVLALSSAIPIVLGVVLLANPFGVTRAVIIFFGISLLVDGAGDLGGILYARSKK